MHKSTLLPSILTLSTVLLSACGFTVVTGSGNLISETRQASNFDAVDIAGSGDVIILQGNDEYVKVEAEDNLLKYIHTEVRGNTLHIYMDPANSVIIQPTRTMRFYVSMKNITALDLSGSGSIRSDKITARNLDMHISGSGDVSIKDLKAESVSTDLTGSGNCNLQGEAVQQTLIITGSGDCNTAQLANQDARVNVSGSGTARVSTTNTLDVTVNGSGDVYYTGSPKISRHITGSGDIKAE
jgi:predicted small secreted protein